MATQVLGSPDYQRRDGASATALYKVTQSNEAVSTSPFIDTSGFESVLVSTNNGAVSDTYFMQTLWYTDTVAGSLIAQTDWVPSQAVSTSFSTPCYARYMKLTQTPVAGADGTVSSHFVYGTNGPLGTSGYTIPAAPNILTSPSVGAGLTVNTASGAMWGGEASINIRQDTNNKWSVNLQYYDISAATFLTFATIDGPDHGQSFNARMNFPYSPCRAQLKNTDTAAHVILFSMVTP